jgi:transketolase
MTSSTVRAHGQSYWLDNLTRRMIADGGLARRVRDDDLDGVTSNPAIFYKAIAGSGDYDEQIRRQALRGRSVQEIYDDLTTTDVRDACDILRPVFARRLGLDGFVSLEISPHLAYDSAGSIAEARRLYAVVDRTNLLIKIPGTAAGVMATEELLFAGINVNVTLLFSVAAYQAVADAYLRSLERRLEGNLPIDGVASVASFFLSRIDVLVDRLLGQRTSVEAALLQGKAGIATARQAYRHFRDLMAGARWQRLAQAGGRPQRLLWASTSTKNSAYSDLMYVEPLIGPQTVNTMTEATIAAFTDHGEIVDTLVPGMDGAQRVMTGLAAVGIDFGLVAGQLESEGVQKFIEPYETLLDIVSDRRDRYVLAGNTETLEMMARKLRREAIAMTTAAGSGHPTSCLSCADIVAALFFREMRWDPAAPCARNADRFVLSKGHAAPIWWAALHEAGAIEADILSWHRLDGNCDDRPTAKNPWLRAAAGALGLGLVAACGIALANRLDGIDAQMYCLLGDGECSAGAVWEAAQFASLNRLARLVAIVDLNGLAQGGAAPYGHDGAALVRRFQAFGWKTMEIDGHDMPDIVYALHRARDAGPTVIIARTRKGRGVSFLEGAAGWQGKALDEHQMAAAFAELGAADVALRIEPRHVTRFVAVSGQAPHAGLRPAYPLGGAVATGQGFAHALRQLGALIPEMMVLDGGGSEATGTRLFGDAYPQRFVECGISEGNMFGAALGLAVCGKLPFISGFAGFPTGAADFISTASQGKPQQLVFCGSHAGIDSAADVAAWTGLEDFALFRALNGSTILCPCDAVSAERLTEVAARTAGIVYLRTGQSASTVIYGNEEAFVVGGSKTLRSSPADLFTVVAAGITVHEALAAYDSLKGKGVVIRVIDAYSVKPVDAGTLIRAARETRAMFVVEDHGADGGLGDAVAATVAALGLASAVHRLAITAAPCSGSREQLLDCYGISRNAIERRVLQAMTDATPAA